MAFTITSLRKNYTHSGRSFEITGPFGLVPQELLDSIISHLLDDTASLLSCALVHPNWTTISRIYLCALDLVVSSPSRARKLTKFLCSTHGIIPSSITGITIVGDLPLKGIPVWNRSYRARSYRKLLHVLKAKGIKIASGAVKNDPSLIRMLANYYPDLTDLTVSCEGFQNMSEFIRALCGSFPQLVELCIERGSLGMSPPDKPLWLYTVKLSMPCLRTLRVVGWNNELVWWLANNVKGTLECLALESTSLEATCRVVEANSLIQRNRTTLKSLKLTFKNRDFAFDLSALVHLRNLEVTSGESDTALALVGWRLPRSLKRVHLRNVACVMGWCGHPLPQHEEHVIFEGARLKVLLGI